jgi:hypothetical protein
MNPSSSKTVATAAVLLSLVLVVVVARPGDAYNAAPGSIPVSPGPIKVASPMNPPTNVHRVQPETGVNKAVDPCAGHDDPIGKQGCLEWLKSSAFVLVWDWSPHCASPNCQATGFIVYRVDGGRHQDVGSAAPPLTLAGIPKSKVSSPQGTCYVVRAQNSTLETESATYCLP